jgi:acyl-CoA synthetase (AMP-forming)/AMP-acid ligase II
MTERTIAQASLPPATCRTVPLVTHVFRSLRRRCRRSPDCEQTGEIVSAALKSWVAERRRGQCHCLRDGWFRPRRRRIGNDGLCTSRYIKDVINRGGAKGLPARSKGALAEHPQVVEAAVFAVTCDAGKTSPPRLRDSHKVDEGELRVVRALARSVPTRIIALPALPRGSLEGEPLGAARIAGRCRQVRRRAT